MQFLCLLKAGEEDGLSPTEARPTRQNLRSYA